MKPETPSLQEMSRVIKNKVNVYFVLSTLIIAYINIFKFPALNIYGEIIGEMGKVYFYQAKYESVWTNLTTVVSAFIPMTERIFSLLVVKVFGLEAYYPWLVQGASVLLVSSCCSLINCSQFKKVIDDDFSRFIISLMLGSCLYLDSMKLYNAPYIGVLFVLWVIYIDKEKCSILKLTFIFIAMFILLIGKAHYIAFAPVHALILYFAFKRKLNKTFIFNGAVTAVHIIQLLVTLSIKAKWDASHAKLGSVSILGIIEYSCKYLFFDIASLGGPFFNSLNIYLLIVFIFTLLFIGIYKMWQSEHNKVELLCFGICIFVAFTSIALSIKGFPDYASAKKLNEHFVYHYRHFLFSDTLIIIGMSVLLYKILRREWFRCVGMALLMIIMISKNNFPDHQPSQTPSKWEIYSSLLEKDDYYIPTWTFNPQWFIQRNSTTLAQFSLKNESNAIQLEQLEALKLEPSNWKVRGFIMALQNTYSKNKKIKLQAVALNKKNEIIAKTVSLVPIHYKFQYFRFDEMIEPAAIVLMLDGQGQLKFPKSKIVLFGNYKNL